jgi:hypothetical protein
MRKTSPRFDTEMTPDHIGKESGKNHRFTGLGNVSFIVIYELAIPVADADWST